MTNGDITRTRLASERTWLAWFRTGLAGAVAALAVGRLAPVLVGGPKTPYILLGAGYGALAVGIVVFGAMRHRALLRGVDEERAADLDERVVYAATAAVVLLTVGTLVVVIGSV
jgi:putative membrane protein